MRDLAIGLVHYGLDRRAAGIGRYTAELGNVLAGQGIVVHRLWAGARPPLTQDQVLRGARLLPGLLTIGQWQIAQLARRLGLDVVHDPTGAMALLLTRAARILTIHDTIPYTYPRSSTRLDWLIYHAWLPWAVRAADAVLTDSRRSREDIVTHLRVAPERVVVVPLAADRRFRPMRAAEIDPVLTLYGVERPYILYVGSLEARKNLRRLLEAYARLRQWSGHWTLVIVGARRVDASPIFETARQLRLESHVRFTGYVDDHHLPALYAGADLFVFPSLYEGFGLPVLEAMASGTPVVTSNSSSLPEVAGDAALLVDPTCVEALAEAMRRVLNDAELQADLCGRGLERAAEFSWERTARETVEVYRKVLSSQAGIEA
jgi:glycosyltransferase involved in cell wall biosynthesis